MGSMILFIESWYWVFGLLGCVVITLAIVATAMAYRGVQGQRYSFLNHYISELGEVGVSQKAGLFNTGMIITGLLFVPFTVGLGLILRGMWGFLGGVAGLWAGISCLLVGVFPMNNLTPHSRVATSYFRGGLATVLLFTIAIFLQTPRQEAISRWVNLAGIVAVISYASFITISAKQDSHQDQQVEGHEPVITERPNVWIIAILEWLVFFTTILWFLVVTIAGG